MAVGIRYLCVKSQSMIAKIRLIINAAEIEDAYERLEQYNDLDPDERKGIRRPSIPKYKYRYTPIAVDPLGIKLAYQEGDVIQLKHTDSGEWLPLKNEPKVWDEISSHLNNVKVRGFGK